MVFNHKRADFSASNFECFCHFSASLTAHKNDLTVIVKLFYRIASGSAKFDNEIMTSFLSRAKCYHMILRPTLDWLISKQCSQAIQFNSIERSADEVLFSRQQQQRKRRNLSGHVCRSKVCSFWSFFPARCSSERT